MQTSLAPQKPEPVTLPGPVVGDELEVKQKQEAFEAQFVISPQDFGGH